MLKLLWGKEKAYQTPSEYPRMYVNSDLASLAKAAVSGDEAALDLLSWNRGGGKVKMSLGPQESLCFFVGGTNGAWVDYLYTGLSVAVSVSM